MLGVLSVSHDARACRLPASRKARALLAYLALAPTGLTRHRLCTLLWETSADPRGELRWYLNRLRKVLGAERVGQRDETVRLDLGDDFIDAREIRRAAQAGFSTLSAQRARSLLDHFRGEFLEGLEIDQCPAFSGWLLTQRRRYRAWHVELLVRITETCDDDEAVGYLERWLEIAPFDIRAHESLLRVLVRLGKAHEAEEHFMSTLRQFSLEGLDCAPLRIAWHAESTRRAIRAFKRSSEDGAHAYDCYLQGRQHLARMMRHGLETGRGMFTRALELDPGYAPAWAGLATVHACLCEWFDGGRVGRVLADQASRRALAAAPQLAESHVARGLERSLSQRFDEAEREFETAIRLNPYLFDAYYYRGRTAFARGDMASAAEMFGLAAQLRVEDFQSPILLNTAQSILGRDVAAHEAAQVGVRRAEQVLALNPHDGRALSLGAGALKDAGQVDRALQWAQKAIELFPDDTSALVNVACVHAQLGQRTEALDMLERVFALGCGRRDWVENDPDYDTLRGEPRFRRLLGNLG
jgi:DNA-binding SARP family transcriptional activator/Tfp pilus assembly protein PilF